MIQRYDLMPIPGHPDRSPNGAFVLYADIEPLLSQLLEAVEASREMMTNQRYNAPRIGMESVCHQCDEAMTAAINAMPVKGAD